MNHKFIFFLAMKGKEPYINSRSFDFSKFSSLKIFRNGFVMGALVPFIALSFGYLLLNCGP